MKKILFLMIALVATVATASAERDQIELDVMSDYIVENKNDHFFEFQNEGYVLAINLKEVPQVGKTYTMDDVIADYTFVKNKYEIIKNQYGTSEWKKYMVTELSLNFSEVDVANKVFKFTASLRADVSIYFLEADFKYDAPEAITVSLAGKCEYLADLDLYAFSAKNEGAVVKEDYSFSLGIKGSAWASGNFVTSDLYTRGNEIAIAGRGAVQITGIDLTLEEIEPYQVLKGNVTDKDGQVYAIEIITNIPGKSGENIELDFGNCLKIEVEKDENGREIEPIQSVEFLAENNEHKFVGWIAYNSKDVPTGSYDLISGSQYGDYDPSLGFYFTDDIKDGLVIVVNDGTNISITATFKQGNDNYTVKASGPAPTGIQNVSATTANAVKKYVENGRLVILKGGKKYSVDAVEIK